MPRPQSTSSSPPAETQTAPPETPLPGVPAPAETPASTIPPQPKAKERRSPLFREPQNPPGPKTGSLQADAAPESQTASVPAALSAPPAPARSTAPASPSSPDPARTEVRKPVRGEIKKFLKDLVNLGAQIVHHVGTYGDEAQQRAGVWLATAEQAEAIAEPAASLVLDHVPPALLQSAVVNGLRVLVGIGSYADHHLTVRREVRYAAGPRPGPQSRPQHDVTGDIDRAQ